MGCFVHVLKMTGSNLILNKPAMGSALYFR